MNRVLFTGTSENIIDENGNVCKINSGNSGVTNWGQGSLTLVEEYFPGSNGNMNIQLDPDEKIGYTEMPADWDSINTSGSNTYERAIPNAERFQQKTQKMIGDVEFNPNKIISIDNRQTAQYLINNLQINDFSIYQRPELRNQNHTPSFFINSNANNYSGTTMNKVPLKKLPKDDRRCRI